MSVQDDDLFDDYETVAVSNMGTNPQESSHQQDQRNMSKLFVRNFPDSMTINGLNNIFSKYGNVVNSYMNEDPFKRYALIEFKSEVSALNAISELDQKPPFNMQIKYGYLKSYDSASGGGARGAYQNGNSQPPIRQNWSQRQNLQPRNYCNDRDTAANSHAEDYKENSFAKPAFKSPSAPGMNPRFGTYNNNHDDHRDRFNDSQDSQQDRSLDSQNPNSELDWPDNLRFGRNFTNTNGDAQDERDREIEALRQQVKLLSQGGVRPTNDRPQTSNAKKWEGRESFSIVVNDGQRKIQKSTPQDVGVPRLLMSKYHCVTCHAEANEHCVNCLTPYCSLRCQQIDWEKRHQNVCHNLAAHILGDGDGPELHRRALSRNMNATNGLSVLESDSNYRDKTGAYAKDEGSAEGPSRRKKSQDGYECKPYNNTQPRNFFSDRPQQRLSNEVDFQPRGRSYQTKSFEYDANNQERKPNENNFQGKKPFDANRDRPRSVFSQDFHKRLNNREPRTENRGPSAAQRENVVAIPAGGDMAVGQVNTGIDDAKKSNALFKKHEEITKVAPSRASPAREVVPVLAKSSAPFKKHEEITEVAPSRSSPAREVVPVPAKSSAPFKKHEEITEVAPSRSSPAREVVPVPAKSSALSIINTRPEKLQVLEHDVGSPFLLTLASCDEKSVYRGYALVNQTVYETLVEPLALACEAEELVKSPEPGAFVSVFCEDGWYRAVYVPPHGYALVDMGQLVADVSQVRSMPDSFRNIGEFSVEMKVVDNDYKLDVPMSYKCIVEKTTLTMATVSVYPYVETEVDGDASAVPLCAGKLRRWYLALESDEPVAPTCAPAPAIAPISLPSPSPAPSSKRPASADDARSVVAPSSPSVSVPWLKLEQDAEVNLLHCSDDFAVYLRLADKKSILEHDSNVQEAAQSAMNAQPLPAPPAVGDMVIGMFVNEPFRAMVLEADPKNDIYRVVYIDYGNEEYVSLSELRVLEADFRLENRRIMVYRCYLSGRGGTALPRRALTATKVYISQISNNAVVLKCTVGDDGEVTLKDTDNGEVLNKVIAKCQQLNWKKWKEQGKEVHSLPPVTSSSLELYTKQLPVGTKLCVKNTLYLEHTGLLVLEPLTVTHDATLPALIKEYCEDAWSGNKYIPRERDVCFVHINGDWVRAVFLEMIFEGADKAGARMLIIDGSYGESVIVDFEDIRRAVVEFVADCPLHIIGVSIDGLPTEKSAIAKAQEFLESQKIIVIEDDVKCKADGMTIKLTPLMDHLKEVGAI